MFPDTRLHPQYLTDSKALITTQAAKRANSVVAELEKNRLADEFIRDARTLRIKAERATRPKDLLDMHDIQAGFLMAAGLSSKTDMALDDLDRRGSAHLVRIRRSFLGLQAQPYLFFIGNAIEASMAGEIWGMLESGDLTNAANMTDDRQAVSLVAWLCSL